MTATREEPGTLLKAGPLFTSVTSPQPIMPQEIGDRGCPSELLMILSFSHADLFGDPGQDQLFHDGIARLIRMYAIT